MPNCGWKNTVFIFTVYKQYDTTSRWFNTVMFQSGVDIKRSVYIVFVLLLYRKQNVDDIISLKKPYSVKWMTFHKAVQDTFGNWPTLCIEIDEGGFHGNAIVVLIRFYLLIYFPN